MKKPIINKQDRYLIIQFPDILKSKLLLLRIAKLKFYRSIDRKPIVQMIKNRLEWIVSSFRLAKEFDDTVKQMDKLSNCKYYPCDGDFDCPYPMESGEPNCK